MCQVKMYHEKVFGILFIFCVANQAIEIHRQFPKEFKFGAATAAYQIEGGWDADGKSPSIWDTYTHEHPELIEDGSNGDIAADSYHNFDEDLKACKELGLQFYRFSIAWSRILPNCNSSDVNQAGIDYYSYVINKLLENKIEPMVTMYHLDLPQYLQDEGGFTNTSLIDNFVSYANVLFENFGDRVKHWITFNEPYYNCIFGYGVGRFPPKIQEQGTADYTCIDVTLKAHAKSYRLYKEKYSGLFGGKIGLALASFFFYSDDKELVQSAMQHQLGIMAHPVYSKSGGYPDSVLHDISERSTKIGLNEPGLKQLDDEWISIIQGSADFFGVNYYTSRILAKNSSAERSDFLPDLDVEVSVDLNWKKGLSGHMYSVPQGLEDLLKWIRNEYNNVEVIIAENGWSDKGENYDDGRVTYIQDHLESILNAIDDGCNVTGYTAWSLIDNFEWINGYCEKFGLYSVNFTSPQRDRVPKLSAKFYKTLLSTRRL